MRQLLVIMGIVLVTFFCEKVEGSSCSFPDIRETSYDFNVGYRRDRLNWRYQDPAISSVLIGAPVIINRVFSKLQLSQSTDIPGAIVGIVDNFLCKNSKYSNSWKDLKAINIGSVLKAVTCNCLFGRFSANYAYYVDGKFKQTGIFAGDSNYLDDLFFNCGYSPKSCKKGVGYSWDISSAIGFELSISEGDFRLIPLIGYAYHDINLHTDTTKYQLNRLPLVTELLSLVSITGIENIDLKSGNLQYFAKGNYLSNWTGPYLGFESIYQLSCETSVFVNFEYHFALYKAHSHKKKSSSFDAKLVIDLDDSLSVPILMDIDGNTLDNSTFDQRAFGKGIFVSLGADRNICESLWAALKFSWVDWKAFKHGRIHSNVKSFIEANAEAGYGTQKYNLDDLLVSNKHIEQDARLKAVHWNSCRIEATLSYNF